MATAYKVFRSEVIKGLRQRSARFEFEPEVTAKLLTSGYKIVEVPISYHPRSVAEGKKIGWIDGIEYIYTVLNTDSSYRGVLKKTFRYELGEGMSLVRV